VSGPLVRYAPGTSDPAEALSVQLFVLPFQHPIEFWLAVAMVTVILGIVFVAAKSPERRGIRWVKAVTSRNSKVLFAILFVIWAVVLGGLLQVVPHTGANSPYGGIALIGLFTGFFITMGFVWSVIGE
jgi:hypothetical protein